MKTLSIWNAKQRILFLSSASVLALSVAAVGFVTPAVAQVAEVITTDDLDGVVFPTVESFDNQGARILNDGNAVEISGHVQTFFTNSGEIVSSASYGVFISGSVGGNFTNELGGVITGAEMGVYISNSVGGNFTNDGDIRSLASHGVYVSGDIGGSFSNTGSIRGADMGFGTADGIGVNFFNSGEIIGAGSYGVFIGGEILGSFTNAEGGLIRGANMGVLVSGNVGGDFTNNGEIISTASHGAYISGNLNGSFSNTGKISGSNLGFGIADAIGGDFFNSGDIISSGSHGVFIGGDILGSFENAFGGVIRGQDIGAELSGNIGGDFTNAGEITSLGSHGVYHSGSLAGSFYNSGRITGPDSAYFIEESIGGDFFNMGDIISSGSYGVHIGGEVNGSFENAFGGVIRGQDIGALIYGSLGENFTNGGEITSTASHGAFVSGDLLGNFSNTGSGSIRGEDIGFGVEGSVGGNFYNSGEIIGSNSYGVFIYGGVLGSFENAEGGLIRAGKYDGVNISGTLSGDFKNDGEIAAQSYGVLISGSLLGDFINKGQMSSVDEDYVAYIDGDFFGDFTSGINQGIRVNGTADLWGRTVTTWVSGYVDPATPSWTAISAGTLVIDDPLHLKDNSVLVDFGYEEVGEDLNIFVSAVHDIAPVASMGGGSGLGLGGVLDAYIGDGLPGPASMDTIVDLAFQQGSASELAYLLNEFSPWARGPAVATYSSVQSFFDTVDRRQNGGIGSTSMNVGGSGADLGVGPVYEAATAVAGAEYWGKIGGGVSGISDDGAIGGYDGSDLNVALGVDGGSGSGTRFGAAFGYTYSQIDGTGGNAGDDATINSFIPAVYAKWQPNAFYLQASAGAAYSSIDQTRVNDAVGETYEANYNGAQGIVRGEVGYEIGMGSASITPFVAGSYSYLWLDGYTEDTVSDVDATDDFGLTVDKQKYGVAVVDIGVNGNANFGPVAMSATAGYRFNFGGFDDTVNASFAGGLPFGTVIEADVSGVFAGADLSYEMNNDFVVGIGANGIAGADYYEITGSAKVGKKF